MHCVCRSCKTEKRYCRSRVNMKHHPNEKLKNTCIMVFSALADLLTVVRAIIQSNPKNKRAIRTSHKTPLKSTTNPREASLRTRWSTTRTKQKMRITMREPRKERTVRTIINPPQNQGITTSTTMGVYRCCRNGWWFALVFGVGNLPFLYLLYCIAVIAPACNTMKKLPQQPKQENQRSIKTRLNLILKMDWTEELLNPYCYMYFKRQIYCLSIINGEIKTKKSGLQ